MMYIHVLTALVNASGCLSIHEPPLDGFVSRYADKTRGVIYVHGGRSLEYDSREHQSYIRWPISCKIGGVCCVEWMPDAVDSSSTTIVLAVGRSNGLELLSLNRTIRKPLRCGLLFCCPIISQGALCNCIPLTIIISSLSQGQIDWLDNTVISGVDNEDVHIERLAWSTNHVVSSRNEGTVRTFLLASGAKNGKITLHRVHQVTWWYSSFLDL